MSGELRWSERATERQRQRQAPTGLARGELRKSVATRERILTAAIALLVDAGFQNLSVITVAERAGLTRAALLYHFAGREVLIRAVVTYLFERRLRLYWDAVKDVPEGPSQIRSFVETYWQQVDSPEFIAFTELAMAARTDRQLAAIVQPALKAYEDERLRYSGLIFSHELRERAGPRFLAIRDVARFLIEGMALAAMTTVVAHDRVEAVKAFVVEQMEAAYRAA